MNAQPLGRLLIVDDEVPQMQALCVTLEAEGYLTCGFSSPRQALDQLRAGEFELLLSDLAMPELDGIALLEQVKIVDPAIATIIMTGHGTIDTAVKAMQVGAIDYIVKPFRLNVILPVIARALDVRRLKLENAALQAREQQYISELETANRDLESFSFWVSHDLRAPLRTISSYCDLYMTEYGSDLPADGREMLGHVLSGVRRMDELTADLLQFCRLSSQPLAKQTVPLLPMVERVVAQLRQTHDQSANVHIAALPSVLADPSLLEQVFVNLLSNAFKFSRRRTPPMIEISSQQRDTDTVIVVRDNGAGFDMQYAQKLFGVFQRLHTQAQFEGTGVGLTLVKQVINRHGGSVWAESQPEQGASFYFTLPFGAD